MFNAVDSFPYTALFNTLSGIPAGWHCKTAFLCLPAPKELHIPAGISRGASTVVSCQDEDAAGEINWMLLKAQHGCSCMSRKRWGEVCFSASAAEPVLIVLGVLLGKTSLMSIGVHMCPPCDTLPHISSNANTHTRATGPTRWHGIIYCKEYQRTPA